MIKLKNGTLLLQTHRIGMAQTLLDVVNMRFDVNPVIIRNDMKAQ
jgi:hypothetical protein